MLEGIYSREAIRSIRQFLVSYAHTGSRAKRELSREDAMEVATLLNELAGHPNVKSDEEIENLEKQREGA